MRKRSETSADRGESKSDIGDTGDGKHTLVKGDVN